MSEFDPGPQPIPSPENQQAPTLADQLGLPSRLNVLRDLESPQPWMDKGWEVHSVDPGSDETGGATKLWVVKPATKEAKCVTLDALLEWNQNTETDETTIPRSVLNEALTQGDAGGELPTDPFSAASADVTVDGTDESKAHEEHLSEIQTKALQELSEQWNLPEGMDLPAVVLSLQRETEELKGIVGTFVRFGHEYGVVKNELVSPNFSVHSAGAQQLGRFIDAGGSIDKLRRFAETRGNFIPNNLRPALDGIIGELRNIQSYAGQLLYETQPNQDFEIRHRLAAIADAALQSSPQILVHIQSNIEDMLLRLGVNEDITEQDAKNEYRSETVQKWKSELSNAATPERFEQIVQEIQNAVAREAEMVDDPNSPRVVFGFQVRSNAEKTRQGYALHGRGGSAPSQRVVAEIMADMLSHDSKDGRDKFKYESSASDPIVVSKDKQAIRGEHRAAALAMIYGAKWIEKGRQLGLTIEQKK